MHILIAGATGAAGRALIPLLIANGHTVTGTTRSEAKTAEIRKLGANAQIMDGLDATSVKAAVDAANPDVIVHQMTSLTNIDFRKFDQSFHVTNRLRTEGTQHLLAAADGRLLVAQSFAGWPAERTGGKVKSEAAPFDPNPPKGIRESLAAIRRLEQLVTEAGGIVLRYGGFYGPGSGMTAGGDQVEMVLKRQFPLVGNGEGIWSFLHTEDIATGTLAAIERGRPGEIYNIVDDDPAPTKEWLPYLAQQVGAKPPRHVPTWMARMLAGRAAVVMMTEARGASNAKAKAELGWVPKHPSWREGFPASV
ncbi:NAD-dependent epimerase/dehydratase family protein [Solirubrobacter soli]|uniref:NAD-dependent epimerase/dehydratase family protein n=1 Tax=Solirubrobacter soli TaxID=363832 RepID=UPI0004281EE2|nr:NAD-dependent epimerase/dehydratase family protein [Solirubrobacter soli]